MKKNNKGFTLVELIVVLVILAILAAILVPSLLGYIERAKNEKDYATAQTVRVAAQAAIDQAYGEGYRTLATGTNPTVTKIEDMKGTISNTTTTYGNVTYTLSGVRRAEVTAFSFDYDNGIISTGTVTINNRTYKLQSGKWTTV